MRSKGRSRGSSRRISMRREAGRKSAGSATRPRQCRERNKHSLCRYHERRRSERPLRVLRQARGERELDKGLLKGSHQSRSPQLPSFHRKPVSTTVARLRLLADGHLEEEAHRKRGPSDADRHLAATSHQDRREGQGASDEDPPASGISGHPGQSLWHALFLAFGGVYE
jgi:hypothetical protein